jgi:hypothetical protein
MYTSTRDSTHERNTGLHLTLDRWVGILFEFYELLNGLEQTHKAQLSVFSQQLRSSYLLCLSVGKHLCNASRLRQLETDVGRFEAHAIQRTNGRVQCCAYENGHEESLKLPTDDRYPASSSTREMCQRNDT